MAEDTLGFHVCALEECDIVFKRVTSQRYCCPDHRRRARKCPSCKSRLPVDRECLYCRECSAVRARIRRSLPHVSEQAVRSFRLKNFGITADQYAQMLEEQSGVCAICSQPQNATINGRPRTLCVDHDHQSGRVRALLCHNCNTGLGLFGDDPARLQAAIAYLEAHHVPRLRP